MADPLSIIAGVVTLIEITSQLSKKISMLCQCSKKLEPKLRRLSDNTRLVAGSLRLYRDTIATCPGSTLSHPFAQDVKYQLTRSEQVVTDLNLELDRINCILKSQQSIFGRMSKRVHALRIYDGLEPHEQELQSARDALNYGFNVLSQAKVLSTPIPKTLQVSGQLKRPDTPRLLCGSSCLGGLDVPLTALFLKWMREHGNELGSRWLWHRLFSDTSTWVWRVAYIFFGDEEEPNHHHLN